MLPRINGADGYPSAALIRGSIFAYGLDFGPAFTGDAFSYGLDFEPAFTGDAFAYGDEKSRSVMRRSSAFFAFFSFALSIGRRRTGRTL